MQVHCWDFKAHDSDPYVASNSIEALCRHSAACNAVVLEWTPKPPHTERDLHMMCALEDGSVLHQQIDSLYRATSRKA